jgi:hypothetical protein
MLTQNMGYKKGMECGYQYTIAWLSLTMFYIAPKISTFPSEQNVRGSIGKFLG